MRIKSLIIIFTFLTTYLNSQTIHGVKSGLDSIAALYHIKTKFVSVIKLESAKKDTTWTQKYEYSSKGFIMRFEEFDIKNLDTNKFWKKGYHLIDFKYNDRGFLIDYDLKWNDPVNIPTIPDSNQITTKQIFKNNSLEKELIVRTTWHNNYDSYSDTTLIFYKENGKISKVTTPDQYEKTYFYNDLGLLIKIEYSNRKRIFKVQNINYEFY